MSEIGRLATEIIDNELSYLTGTDRDVAISRASGWLLNNFGQLNNKIFTCYSGENPGLKYEESSIYKSIYLNSFYRGKAGSVLRNMDTLNLEWLSLREGDSSIQLQNKNEVAKTFIHLSKEFQSEIDKLVTAYNIYQAFPREVDVVYTEDGALSGPIENVIRISEESYYANGFIDIESGTNVVAIPLSLSTSPSKISLSLVKPSGGDSNLSYSVIGTSISNTGFMVSLGATVGESGYRLNYGVK